MLDSESYASCYAFFLFQVYLLELVANGKSADLDWKVLFFVIRDKKTCNIIDIAVPGDAGIVEKEKEKVEKYQDLRREVTGLWNVKAKVVPIVVGALGAVTPNLSKYLDVIGVTTRIELLQKAALLGTARLLRRVLEAWSYET